MARFGPQGKSGASSQKKICLAATDRAYLVRFLYELSLQSSCYYVKYSAAARDGMYLGRAFLRTDQAAGRLCHDLKQHPKLLVSIQDDDFFLPFRDG